MEEITVIKRNPQGEETFRYAGVVKQRLPGAVLLEAYFNRKDTPFHGTVLKKEDRFIEAYYADRWYNIFEIYDRQSEQLKGWYCNVTMPAQISAGEIRYMDLALDLLVYPDGRQLVLDEDEFSALDALLRALPDVLAPGARVAFLTFHSGEDRRVKQAFRAGHRSGIYAAISEEVITAGADERRLNPRSSSAKLRWAVRA